MWLLFIVISMAEHTSVLKCEITAMVSNTMAMAKINLWERNGNCLGTRINRPETIISEDNKQKEAVMCSENTA